MIFIYIVGDATGGRAIGTGPGGHVSLGARNSLGGRRGSRRERGQMNGHTTRKELNTL